MTKTPNQETFNRTLQLRVNDEFLATIDNWMATRGYNWSRSECIRHLVRFGANASTPDKQQTDALLSDVKQALKDFNDGKVDSVNLDELDIAAEHSDALNRVIELTRVEEALHRGIEDDMAVLKQLRTLRRIFTSVVKDTNVALIEAGLPPKQPEEDQSNSPSD